MKSNKIKYSCRDAEAFQQHETGIVLWFLLCGKQGNFATMILIQFCGESAVPSVPSVSCVTLHGNYNIKIVISRGVIMVQASKTYT